MVITPRLCHSDSLSLKEGRDFKRMAATVTKEGEEDLKQTVSVAFDVKNCIQRGHWFGMTFNRETLSSAGRILLKKEQECQKNSQRIQARQAETVERDRCRKGRKREPNHNNFSQSKFGGLAPVWIRKCQGQSSGSTHARHFHRSMSSQFSRPDGPVGTKSLCFQAVLGPSRGERRWLIWWPTSQT